MIIRFKVAYDDGTIRCGVGETTGELSHGQAARLVRAGIAEAIPGNRGINTARAAAGMSPVRGRARPRKK
jgi:hypothetical protein